MKEEKNLVVFEIGGFNPRRCEDVELVLTCFGSEYHIKTEKRFSNSYCGVHVVGSTITETILYDIERLPWHPPLLPIFKGPWTEIKVGDRRICDRCLRALAKKRRNEKK